MSEYIEGDNLEALKCLRNAYAGKVKMIYIDPPYNTDAMTLYCDYFRGKPVSTDDAGKHTKWLNMMYPRIKLAKELLKEDGVIFISIDDIEIENLKRICNSIFGAENYRNTIIVRRRTKSLNNQFSDLGLNSLNIGYEYILVYSKSKNFIMNALRVKKDNIVEKGRWDVFWSNADRPTMRYEILGFTPLTGQWRNSKEKADIAVENYKKYINEYSSKLSIEEYSNATGITEFIRRIPDGQGKNGGVQHWIAPSDTVLRTSNWLDIEVSQISKEIDIPFDNPKNKILIIELLKLVPLSSNDIILDFFAGSSTTAHAIMQYNAEINQNNKFIMVQLNEEIKPSFDKDGKLRENTNNQAIQFLDLLKKPHTIAEIGKERIRRAGDKVKQEAGLLGKDLDVGFKVFKLN